MIDLECRQKQNRPADGEYPVNYGNCNWGYNCAYTNSMSWISPEPNTVPDAEEG